MSSYDVKTKPKTIDQWLSLKKFQFDITYGLYMFTPTERFIMYSILFLICSLTFIATVLYLPQHFVFILDRAWFYIHGDDSGIERVISAIGSFANRKASEVLSTATAANAAVTAAATVAREL